MFERLITTTHDKYDEDVEKLDELFGLGSIAQSRLDR